MLVARYLGGEGDQDLGQYRQRADEERGQHQKTEGGGQRCAGEGHDQTGKHERKQPPATQYVPERHDQEYPQRVTGLPHGRQKPDLRGAHAQALRH